VSDERTDRSISDMPSPQGTTVCSVNSYVLNEEMFNKVRDDVRMQNSKLMQVLDDTLEMLIIEFGSDIVGSAFVQAVGRVDGKIREQGWRGKLIRMEAQYDAASIQLHE